MEYKVLQENIVLEVALTIREEFMHSNATVRSDVIKFNDCLTFEAKHISYPKNNVNHNYREKNNIVLIRINNLDTNNIFKYRIKLSCPEFEIQQMTLYSNQSHWHVVDENCKTGQYTFTITLESEVLTHVDFSELYEDEQLIDFKLKGKDGEINIHKVILAATSSSFKSEVTNGDENVSSLDIPTISVNTLQDFKKCIYMKVYPNENVEKLLLLASYFNIKWLEFKCVDIIMKNISSGDVLNLLEFAIEHKQMPLFIGILDCVKNGTLKMSEVRKDYLKILKK